MTEAFLRWLQTTYPNVQTAALLQAQINHCTLKFDFSSSECWIIELDYDIPHGHFSDEVDNDCLVRDLEKEEWASSTTAVIRVLRTTWRDKNG